MDEEDKNFYMPYLITRSLKPENQETPIHFLREWHVPDEYHFRRNHFLYPSLPEQAFLLPVGGEVEKPTIFSYQNILSMPAKTLLVTLECAGNKRSRFRPKVYGEQWEDGAISQGAWKGVPLSHLLAMVGVKGGSAREVVFEGYDHGKRTDLEGVFPYARSLPIDVALHPDILVAYEYNSKPISYRHGYPLRLVAPQWYAMASVKWLKKITVIDHAFQGPFQAIDYNYYPYKESDIGKRPVTAIKVNSTIQQPADYSKLDTGVHRIEGIAYTGQGVITHVEISFNMGKDWEQATLYQDGSEPYSWTFWEYLWNVSQKGEYTIIARARDSEGGIQPPKAQWNRKGYGYNAVSIINVKVE